MSVQRHVINQTAQPLDFTSGYQPLNLQGVATAVANRRAEIRRNEYLETKSTVDDLIKSASEATVNDKVGAQEKILELTKNFVPTIKKYGINSPEWQAQKIKASTEMANWSAASESWSKQFPELVKQIKAPDSYLKQDEAMALLKANTEEKNPTKRDLTLGVRFNIDPNLVNVPAWIQGELTKSTPLVKSEYATTNDNGDVTTTELTHPSFGSIDKNGVYKAVVPMEQSEALRMTNKDRAKAYVRSVNQTPEFLEKMGSSYDAERDEAKAFNLAVNMFAANSHTLKPNVSGVKTQLKTHPQSSVVLYDTKKRDSNAEFEDRVKTYEDSFNKGDVGHLSAISGKPYKKDAEGNLVYVEGRKKIKVKKDEYHKMAMQYASKNKGEAEPASTEAPPATKNKYDF